MIHYIVYVSATGEILRTGICPADMMFLQARDGESVIEGTANDETQMVVGGQVVDKPEVSA